MKATKKSNPKMSATEKAERKFDRDLKSCMKCHCFWGNASGCLSSNCFKEKRKEPEKTVYSECTDCSYKQGDGYCFPCMKKLLERK
ncbi:MAG: hypothetical protein ACLRZ7_01610 [Lachnospiraceae bacterium]